MQAPFAVNPSPPARQVTLYISGLFAGPAAPSAELRTGPEPLMRLLARADQLPGGAEGETQRLVAELNEPLAQAGWLLKAPRPERWYLKPPAAAAITTTPLAAANGRNVQPLLPQGPDRKARHTRLNEIQILLYTSPVNAAREARGLLPANSVWFWGGGGPAPPGGGGWTRVSSDDPLCLGLARLAGVSSGPLPANGKELLAHPGGGEQLLMLGLPTPILSQADTAR